MDRVDHLTTQLIWRLEEGDGTAFYQIGVLDSG
jgi:GTPase